MRSLVLAGVVSLCACGDDGGTVVDARLINQDTPVACAAAEAYGEATPLEPSATRDADTNPEVLQYYGSLNTDYDDLGIELYKGYGVFATGELAPTTVELTGEEAQYETCGACVVIYANTDADTGDYDMMYLAVGGTLTITAVTPNITGTLTNASLVHVDLEGETTSPAADGCASSVASFAFDTPVMTDTSGNVAPARRRALHARRRAR